MPLTLPFFIASLSNSIAKSFAAITSSNRALESDERLINTDVICEGPIEGLVDKEGNLLKYITDSGSNTVESIVLGKGIYYNDAPLIDDKLNKLNFVTQGFDIRYGEEFNNYTQEYASTVHRYNKKIYLNENDYQQTLGIEGKSGMIAAQRINNISSLINGSYNNNLNLNITSNIASDNGIANSIISTLQTASIYGQLFIHKIVNKYCDQLSIHIKLDSLFNSNKGNTNAGTVSIGILIEEDNSANIFAAIFAMTGISKAGYVFDIPINLNLDSVNKNTYYVKVFALSQKIDPLNGNIFKEISISSIIERVRNKGSFSYPFSSIVRSSVSSNHFNSDPQRSFDLKLLKIKVPKNYDSEIGEYEGNWDGNFDNFLRWTDNPAWIFYDICTNPRYGVGNGNVSDKDLNKWELYKISKYCDELVLVNTPAAYAEDFFTIYDQNTIIVNKVALDSNLSSLTEFKKKYPSISDNTNANKNGGRHNSLIFLYNLSDDNGSIDNTYKKIIVSVDEVAINPDTRLITVVAEGDGAAFRIKLMNDFGPRKFFENGNTANFLKQFTDTNVSISSSATQGEQLSAKIAKSIKNTQSGAKDDILYWLDYNSRNNTEYAFPVSFINKPCFSEDVLKNGTVKGSCLPKTLNYKDPLEKRFSCNLLIDNETEFLKVLNDIASVFRGLTYYKNNFITSTIDVEKPVSYLFNNSNVKDGSFSYSSGSVDGNYSVAKVMYRDKYLNYDQQVEIIEDSLLVNSYGIVTKEILGFGITSRDQARRIGEWLLATNRFENQTVSFVTDLQGLILKPSDVIQIEDQFKNNSILQGRVTSVNYTDEYITVDRKINLNSTGELIKFLADIEGKTISSLNAQTTVSDSDINDLNLGDIIELRIDRIENDTNRIYFDKTYKFYNFIKIISSTPFIIENSKSNIGPNLYKVVSISETSNNEYSFFCIKHEKAKYEALTKGSYQKNNFFVDNTISYADSDVLKEVNLSGMNSSYYDIDAYSINEVNALTIDYGFNEQQTSLVYNSQRDYYVLNLKIFDIFNYINSKSSAGTDAEKKYYAYIQETLNKKGGLLFKIILKNQSLKFKIQDATQLNKRIFLGKFGSNKNIVTASSGIRIYLFDKNNKIIEV
jgi:hypothetical protein